MAVYVKIRLGITSGPSPPTTLPDIVGLVNSGYRAESPELILPQKLAERMGWWPELPAGALEENYESAGDPFPTYIIEGALEVGVIAPDCEVDLVVCDAVVSPRSREVLISDALTSQLKIVVVDPFAGIWQFRGEGEHLRESETRQIW